MKRFLAETSAPWTTSLLREVDRWLPDSPWMSVEVYRARARVLVLCLAVAFLGLGGVSALALLRGEHAVLNVAAPASLWFVANVVLLGRGERLAAAERWYLVGVTVACFAAVTVTGGIRSEMIAWVPVYAVLVAVVGGARGGALGVLLSTAAVVAWAAADRLGWGVGAVQGSAGDRGLHAVLAEIVIMLAFFAREQVLAEAVRERAQVQAALESAEAEARARRGAVAHVTHELRGPLAGMVGLAELLIDDGLSPEAATRARTIRDTGGTLVQLVADLHDAARLESGALAVVRAPFEPRVLLEQVVVLFRAAAEAVGTELSWTATDAVPVHLNGDRDRIRQVLCNLVSNAVKYTRDGKITVSLDAIAARTRWAVSDTGSGIPPERLSAIFGRYVQVDAERDRHLGSGLGLAIARLAVEAMGGALYVASEVGEGSRFTFYLRTEQAASPDTPNSPAGAVHALRVLVVDDSAVNRTVVGHALRSLGHEVVAVATGLEAMDAVRAGGVDVVVMDLHLAEEDGMTVARALRRVGGENIPIVGVTATLDASLSRACAESGMCAVLTRPVAPPTWASVLSGCGVPPVICL